MKPETIAIMPKPAAPKTSWWAAHCQPGQFESFSEAAQTRHAERTRLDDLREGKKNQAMKHVISPREFQPKVRR